MNFLSTKTIRLAAVSGLLALSAAAGAPALAGNMTGDIGEERTTKQTDGGSVTTHINADGSVTVTTKDANGNTTRTDTYRPRG